MSIKGYLENLVDEVQHAVRQIKLEDASSLAAARAVVLKLDKALESSPQAILRQRFHTVENLCIIAAEEMGLLETLSSEEEGGDKELTGREKTAYDLAAVTGYDETMIARIMRVITAIGFADEVGYQRYKANAITRLQNSPGAMGAFILTNDFMFALANRIRDYFRQLKPCKLSEVVPAYDFASRESIWKTLREKPEWKTGFDNAMRSRQKLFSTPWHVKFPLTKHLTAGASGGIGPSSKPIIVDIGGNQGIDLQRIVDSYPHLSCRLVLQDLPETIRGIPSDSLSEKIEQMPYDFFTPQPVLGASIYYMKSVLHDWDNTASQKILSNTAQVMNGNSRLLVNDIVLADTNESADRADMDVLMLFISNGMERSESQWAELLASVTPALEIVNIWSLPEDPQSVIETRLARSNL